MSHNTTLELPLSGILSFEEKKQAAKLIAEVIKSKTERIEQVPNYHLHCLLNEFEGGDVTHAYKWFIQDLLLMMLKPDNAAQLYGKHGKDAGRLFDNLINFFDGLGSEKDLDRWQDLERVSQYFHSMKDKEVYRLWQEYVNPDQKIIG
ncbi:MAG: hypothetical protein WKF97_08340 [Chitinophagaceae bacterium]